MKQILALFLLFNCFWLQASQNTYPIITYAPDFITDKDSVTIYYESFFGQGGGDCFCDSTDIKSIDDTTLKIQKFYEVSYVFLPCEVFDSIKLGILPSGDYKFELSLIQNDFEFTYTNTISFTVYSTTTFKGIVGEPTYSLFPNPATNTITLEEIEPNSTLTIYNTLGKEVLRQVATGKEETLDISTLTKGLYFMTIKIREGKVVTQKFVKE